MGISLGSLIQTAGGAFQKRDERRLAEEERRRQREMDVLQRALMQAQTTKLLRPDVPSPEPLSFHPTKTGEIKGFGTRTGRVVATGEQRVPPTAQGKPLFTPNERRAAQQVITALEEQNRLEETDPLAGVYPAKAAAAAGIASFGIGGAKPFQGLAGPVAQRLLTANQAAFRRAGVTAQHHYLSLLPHSRGSLGILEHINQATAAPPGQENPAVLASFRQARQDIINQLRAALAGDPSALAAPPEREPSPLAQPGGPPPAPAPAQPPTGAPQGYNPRFWKP